MQIVKFTQSDRLRAGNAGAALCRYGHNPAVNCVLRLCRRKVGKI